MATTQQTISRLFGSPEPIRWVFTGDSITHGALHTMGWRDYVELFGERVRWELGRGRDCVIKTGVSGWRITTLADDLDWSLLQHRPQVSLLNFGMNDCAEGSAGVDEFVRVYLDVLDRLAVSGCSQVVVQTPNRIMNNDLLRYPSLPEYVAAIRSIAAKSGALLVDHFSDWESWERDGTLPFLLSDPIHPNELGHRLMNRSTLTALSLWDPRSRTGRFFIS